MSNKNPFEIRADILEMAKDYMDRQYKLNVEFTTKMFEAGQKTAEDVREALTPYSVEELTEKAQEMYSFVSKKD